MTAATDARLGKVGDGLVCEMPMQASSAVKAGWALMRGIGAAGAGVAGHVKSLAAASAASHEFCGIAENDCDNSAGAAAAKDVRVILDERTVEFVAAGLADTDHGKEVWLTDNQTVTTTPPADGLGFKVGRIAAVIAATKALVKLDNAIRKTFVVNGEWNAASVDKRVFTALKPCRVVGMKATVTAAGTDAGAVTAVLCKVASGNAIDGAATPLHSSTINLKGTANTVQNLTNTTTLADLLLAPGDSIAIDFTGTLTAATGVFAIEVVEV